MSDEVLCNALRYEKWDEAADRIEALTEQLEAARADAKEAEAYAEGLEKEIELNEQEACMLEDDFIKADKEIDALTTQLKTVLDREAASCFRHDAKMADLEAKLAAAVDWFETIRDRAKGDYMAHTYYLDALAALATIERSDDP
jgi:chromosome segregation ATPase